MVSLEALWSAWKRFGQPESALVSLESLWLASKHIQNVAHSIQQSCSLEFFFLSFKHVRTEE
jgi:hypothetical protein